jgi:hypothetical protein
MVLFACFCQASRAAWGALMGFVPFQVEICRKGLSKFPWYQTIGFFPVRSGAVK